MEADKSIIRETKAEETKVNAPEKKVKKDNSRKVFDNIHGFIRFEKRIWKFIDTVEFQKLRYIKQLGCLSMVFPGATHTRFQHSLGTGHLAQTFIRLLIKNNYEHYKMLSQKEIESAVFTVTLAGVMHDVGHGPFSHTFDGEIVKTRILQKGSTQIQEEKWSHERGSELIFREICQKYKLVGNEPNGIITPQEIQRVVKLIHGISDGTRQWEFELISNKETGIDVDKLDYFRRDAFYLGAKGVQIDHELLMNEARILVEEKDNKKRFYIGYPSKYALQVNQIFYSRYKLYKTYYLNNISKGVEFMIMDVLKLVEPIFKFTEICRNIKQGRQWIQKYCQLTDSVLERIEFLDEKNEEFRKIISNAKIILRDIKLRKIYKFVRQVQTSITLERLQNHRNQFKEIFNVENISKFIEQKTQLNRKLFHVTVTEAGYGLKQLNPLNKVKFFRKQEFTEQDEIYTPINDEDFRAENISILYTKAFAERYAKLYVTGLGNAESVMKINEAFVRYFNQMKQRFGNMFNHINLGRTSFVPVEYESHINVEDFQGDEQNLP